MINALHLIWIIPCSAMFGYALAALFVASSHSDVDRREWKDDDYDEEEG